MNVNYAVDIRCPPERVWYWLGTPEKAMAWQSGVTRTEIVHQTPDWVGTTFRETVAESGKGVEMQGVVTAYEENRLLAMHLSSSYNTVDVAWRIQAADGLSRLTADSNVRFKSFLWLVSLILRPAFKRNILAQLHTELARLKELCEGSD